jgi:hypothetical protein
MPLLDLIMLARCSQRLAKVLHSERFSRLDGMFVTHQPERLLWNYRSARYKLPFLIPRGELDELFGEGHSGLGEAEGQIVGLTRTSYFVESAHIGNVRGSQPSAVRFFTEENIVVGITNFTAVGHFMNWLQWRHEQWLAAQP